MLQRQHPPGAHQQPVLNTGVNAAANTAQYGSTPVQQGYAAPNGHHAQWRGQQPPAAATGVAAQPRGHGLANAAQNLVHHIPHPHGKHSGGPLRPPPAQPTGKQVDQNRYTCNSRVTGAVLCPPIPYQKANSPEIFGQGWMRWDGRKRFVVITAAALESFPDATKNVVDNPGHNPVTPNMTMLFSDVISVTHDINPKMPGLKLYRRDTAAQSTTPSLSLSLNSYLSPNHKLIDTILSMIRSVSQGTVTIKTGKVPVPHISDELIIRQLQETSVPVTKADIDEFIRRLPSGEHKVQEEIPPNLYGIKYGLHHAGKVNWYRNLETVRGLFEGELDTIVWSGVNPDTIDGPPIHYVQRPPNTKKEFLWPERGSARIHHAIHMLANMNGEMQTIVDSSRAHISATLSWMPGANDQILFDYEQDSVGVPFKMRWLVRRSDSTYANYVSPPDHHDQHQRVNQGQEAILQFREQMLPQNASTLWYLLSQWWMETDAAPATQNNIQVEQHAPSYLPLSVPPGYFTSTGRVNVSPMRYGAWTPMRNVDHLQVKWDGTHSSTLTVIGRLATSTGNETHRRPVIIRHDSRIRLSSTLMDTKEPPKWQHCEGYASHLLFVEHSDLAADFCNFDTILQRMRASYKDMSYCQRAGLIPPPPEIDRCLIVPNEDEEYIPATAPHQSVPLVTAPPTAYVPQAYPMLMAPPPVYTR